MNKFSIPISISSVVLYIHKLFTAEPKEARPMPLICVSFATIVIQSLYKYENDIVVLLKIGKK